MAATREAIRGLPNGTWSYEMPLDGYRDWIARLPNGDGRRKLEGLLRFGEIEINASHTGLLRQALDAGGACSEAESEWSVRFREMLQAIDEEPALYLMVRRRPGAAIES